MIERRGRPKEIIQVDKPRKFIRTLRYEDGVVSTWTYDLDKNSYGPVEVTNDYPKNFLSETQKDNKTDKKYFNPSNGKFIGYGRAKTLGLID